jgi:hypothetical protein
MNETGSKWRAGRLRLSDGRVELAQRSSPFTVVMPFFESTLASFSLIAARPLKKSFLFLALATFSLVSLAVRGKCRRFTWFPCSFLR